MFLGTLASFAHGLPADAQAYGGSHEYANYAYGVFMAAAGFSLAETLNSANLYGAFFSSYSANKLNASSSTPAIPPENASNITNGFNDEANNTLCSVEK